MIFNLFGIFKYKKNKKKDLNSSSKIRNLEEIGKTPSLIGLDKFDFWLGDNAKKIAENQKKEVKRA